MILNNQRLKNSNYIIWVQCVTTLHIVKNYERVNLLKQCKHDGVAKQVERTQFSMILA